jgi:glycosyltransferase involved in cell wall biosynthesis
MLNSYEKKKLIFISWTPYDNHTETLARVLCAKLYFVHYLQIKKPIIAPIKYLLQAFKTVSILLQEKPNIVLVQNPPIFLPLLVLLFGKIYGIKLIIDSHTAAFLSFPWQQFIFLHKYVSRRAAVTIVTNKGLADIVNTWKAKVCILTTIPSIEKFGDNDIESKNVTKIVCVCSFSADEPILEIIEAARDISNVKFIITGDSSRLSTAIIERSPVNVVFTGFLKRKDYISLLQSANGIIDLTTRDFTLLDGGQEAVALEVPLITSNWPVLQDYFNKGTVYTQNTKEEISKAVKDLLSRQKELKTQIIVLKEELRQRFAREIEKVKSIIAES